MKSTDTVSDVGTVTLSMGVSELYSISGTILVEAGLLALGLFLYMRASTPRDGIGRWALIGLVALTGVIWISQPWAPPPPSATAVAVTALVLWALVPWAAWIERHRDPKPPPVA